MIEIRKILLATDLGQNSVKAMEYARILVSKFGAELHVLHVLEDKLTNTPSFAGGLALNSYVHESPAVAEQLIRSLFEPSWLLDKHIAVATAEGSPADQILDYAKVNSIDLIALGTHGRTGLSHILIGSVAEQVIRHAKCPVVTVPSRS